MDSGALAQLVDTVGSYKQDSLLIVRHGKIVTEVYYAPYAAGISHQVKSVTKSVISTLVAIALREGILDSVDHPVLDLFSDRPIENVDDRKKMITVQNLLDMTSGLNWKEEKYAPDETITRMFESSDPTQFVLNQPMSDVPGTRFYYNSGNPYVLSALITKKTGKSAFEFAQKELFGPLGIESADWGHTDAQGVTNGESSLLLTPRDMAKIGYLYLRGGIWDGKPIIASSWVDRASEGAVKTYSGFHYANLWWRAASRKAPTSCKALRCRGMSERHPCSYQVVGMLLVILPTCSRRVVEIITGRVNRGFAGRSWCADSRNRPSAGHGEPRKVAVRRRSLGASTSDKRRRQSYLSTISPRPPAGVIVTAKPLMPHDDQLRRDAGSGQLVRQTRSGILRPPRRSAEEPWRSSAWSILFHLRRIARGFSLGDRLAAQ
jgi:CubicO group peptidase (beta-lactamase class C family)